MELTEKMKQVLANRSQVEQDAFTALSDKKHIFIESSPGLGKTASVKAAAIKAGLVVLALDLTGGNILPLPGNKEVEKEEYFIMDSIVRSKATAILVEVEAKYDITAFVNVASKLSIPLIVSHTNSDYSTGVISLTVCDKPQEVKCIVDVLENNVFINKTPNKELIEKMRSNVEEYELNKPKLN